MSATPVIYVDTDACPVKDEIYRVAGRYRVPVKLVSNSLIRIPLDAPLIERVVVESGPDVADGWIAERAGPGDIVVTADVPLAARCVKSGAAVLSPTGRLFDEGAIGLALATRNLMDDLRSSGQLTGGPASFTGRNRSDFLSALDLAVNRARRPRSPQPPAGLMPREE